MIRPFKFFGNKEEFGVITISAQVGIATPIDVVSINHTIPAPVVSTITRAIITSRVATFIAFRDDMMYHRPERQYTYGGVTSFTRDNIRYQCVTRMNDLYGRNFDNYILLHDAREIEELEHIVTILQQHGATEMF